MIKKIFSLTFAVVLVLVVFAFPVSAKENKKTVYDLADMLTEQETAEIENAAKKHFSDNGCSVYIVTAKSSDGRVNYFGEHFVEEHLKGDGGDSVILIITDNYQRNYDIYTYGKPDRRISDSEIDDILDNPAVFDNIKGGKNYAAACTKFISMSATACEAKMGLAVILGCIFGALAAIGAIIGIACYYKKKSRSEKYPLNQFASLQLTESNDIFAGTFITKRVINTSSGGKRGGSFGGGGRGHRGGR